ncbi:hypothetical protein FRC18_000414 [Serendipita sp. 400]|nr:hypothetical protein FRC18_000414 [Serendipita sp. 400]
MAHLGASEIPHSPLMSEEFPSGNGTDILLVSSDSTLFYFHQFLLTYTSRVFKDMIQSNDYSVMKPLHLSEDRATIDLLLRHIDPVRVTPNLDSDTVFGLLEASKKYEIRTVGPWFNDQITRENYNNNNDNEEVNVLIRGRPLRLFRIGEELNLPDVSRIALREILKGHSNVLLDENAGPISPRLWRYIISLRMERSRFVSELLTKLLVKTLEAQECSEDEHRRKCFLNDQLRDLIVYVGMLAIEEPRWERFERILEWKDNLGCAKCGNLKTILRTSKPSILDREFKVLSEPYIIRTNIYTDRLYDSTPPSQISSHPPFPGQLPTYENIKETIQSKELELPYLPISLQLSHRPIHPSNPFTMPSV